MKKYRIDSNKIPKLVKLTADLFEVMNKEIAYSSNKGEKATQMHFVADLLKDLVDTAYPTENEPVKSNPTNNNSVKEDKNIKIKELAYKKFIELMKLGELPKHLIPTFEEWEKGVEIIEY